MKRLAFVITATIATLAFTACAKPTYLTPGSTRSSEKGQTEGCAAKLATSGYCVELVWQERPTETKTGSFIFKISRENLGDHSQLVIDPPGDTTSVVLWMPSMGHGSSPVTVTRLDVGTFLANEVFFIMPGEWQIKFQLKRANEVIDEAIVDIAL